MTETCDQAGGDGVDPNRKDNWDNCCCLLYRWDRASDGNDDIDLKADKFGCDLGVALSATLRPAILDRDGTVLDPTEFAQGAAPDWGAASGQITTWLATEIEAGI
jgi:hypothetical protein